MAYDKFHSITMTPGGELTLSDKVRQKLGIQTGTKFIEMLVGHCVLLVPEDAALTDIMNNAQQVLKKAGVSSSELLAELEKVRNERFNREYPGIAK